MDIIRDLFGKPNVGLDYVEEVAVHFGDARFNVSSRGHATSPHNKFRELMKKMGKIAVPKVRGGAVGRAVVEEAGAEAGVGERNVGGGVGGGAGGSKQRRRGGSSRLVRFSCDEIPEYHTSALCSSCHRYLSPAVVKNNVRGNTAQELRRPWALKECVAEGIIWDRDHNSTRNMLFIFAFERATGHRPPGYRAPPRKERKW